MECKSNGVEKKNKQRVLSIIMNSSAENWKNEFLDDIQHREDGELLKQASVDSRLGEWTRLLTAAVVETCEAMQWKATAKNHRLSLLPEPRSEYLSLDVMAFDKNTSGNWHFPKAVFELENSKDDSKIAYSLWKVLCVHTDLSVVLCYRKQENEAAPLVDMLARDVVEPMGLVRRNDLVGEVIVVVGNRGASEYFPYGFFKWWKLDNNTGRFCLMR